MRPFSLNTVISVNAVRKTTVLSLLWLALACSGADDSKEEVGDGDVSQIDEVSPCVDGGMSLIEGALRLQVNAELGTLTVWRGELETARFDLMAFGVREGKASYETKMGSFRITEEADEWQTPAGVEATPSESCDAIALRLHDESDLSLATFRVTVADGRVTLEATSFDSPTPDGRLRLALGCAPDDHFAGLGAQTHDVDHRGQRVPLWVSEQGIGKSDTDEPPLVWFLTGTRHSTHVPIPAVVTSRGTAWVLNTTAYSVFDLCATDPERAFLEVWGPKNGPVFTVYEGPTPLEALARMTEDVGRPKLPPPWAFAPWNDAFGGADAVREVAAFLRDEDISSSAIWFEDWNGGHWVGSDYRRDQDWMADPVQFADLPTLIADLEAMGIHSQLYFNTFIFEGSDVWDSAIDGGHMIRRGDGSDYIQQGPSAGFKDMGLADLTNPETRAWVKSYLKLALDAGALGWMGDYAEWMPVDDAEVASGEHPAWVHNLYPVLWQEVNQEALEESGVSDEACVYFRSGYLGSQSTAQIMWAGDQQTSFRADDGFPTVVPIGLGLAATGFPFYAHDVAGYQSNANTEVPPYTSKELFYRWTSLGAFTPVMRTHHGIAGDKNWNLRSDEETTAHWKRYTDLHVRLYPYLRSLAHRAVDEGRPLWIPLGLVHPADATAWPIMDEFYLGDGLLVAPVVTEAATQREVYLPAGRWVPFLAAGEVVTGPGTITAEAPMAEIPVFMRAGTIVPMLEEPVLTLIPDVAGISDLSDTEGDRVVYVALGAAGSFVEESGASYTLTGTGTGLGDLKPDADGAISLTGDASLAGEAWTLELTGQPAERRTLVILR